MMIKRWNVEEITNQLRSCGYAMNDPYMDGFATWGCKQDLYTIKFILDDILENAPIYSVEQEWLEERAKEKTWKIISK
jgi:hypothetical protein